MSGDKWYFLYSQNNFLFELKFTINIRYPAAAAICRTVLFKALNNKVQTPFKVCLMGLILSGMIYPILKKTSSV